MGLILRYNLFHQVTSAQVYGAYCSFYERRARPLQQTGDPQRQISFHIEENTWSVVQLDGGWEWKERREAQLFVSERLGCAGFLLFVFDGDYWGYEFFDQGVTLDHFVQEADPAEAHWFPDQDCRGNPEVLVAHLPQLKEQDIIPYLVRQNGWGFPEGTNVPPRAGDQYRRFDECAVLNFLRMLGVEVRVVDNYVTLKAPVYRSVFKE